MIDRIIIGDTLSFSTTVPGYSAADGWVLNFRLVPRTTGTPVDITTAADGDDHLAQVAAGITSTWTAGAYSWHSWVEKAGEKYTVDSGALTLVADPRVASALDLRTPAQTALDNVDLVLQGKASSGVLSYRIGERSLESYSVAELLQLRSHLSSQVQREKMASNVAKGLDSGRFYSVRLARA